MTALKFRFVTFYHSLSLQKNGRYAVLVQVELLCKEIWKNLGQSFKNWKLFLLMNRISQNLDVLLLTDARSENIPDLETILKEQKF